MNDDRPIKSQQEDKLGFSVAAEKLATTIKNHANSSGFVIGIEGEWGSGKSSLIELTKCKLGKDELAIIDFAPWLIGDKEKLLSSLMSDLRQAVKSSYDSKLKREAMDRDEKLSNLVSKSSKAFGKEELFTELWQGDLTKRKKYIIKELSNLNKPIIVFIDDLDRLEADELRELLRLVRAVADFPNVTYVLSYDSENIAASFEKNYQINARNYLEKIVQVHFQVPKPETFVLRNWLYDELTKLYPTQEDLESNNNQLRRLNEVINKQGGRFLKKPRDVIRLLNAVKFYTDPVQDKVDISDVVWLQMVRLNMPQLYDWLEEYLGNVAAISRGKYIPEEEKKKQDQIYSEILKKEGIDEWFFYDIQQIIPGLTTTTQVYESDESKIYLNIHSKENLSGYIRQRRLGSPDHYRFYFGFDKPSDALDDLEVAEFLGLLAQSTKSAIENMDTISASRDTPKTEEMIDRLLIYPTDLSQSEMSGLIEFLANSSQLDKQYSENINRRRVWNKAEKLFEKALKSLSHENRQKIPELFRTGKALGWLTNLLRSEIFSHGHYGEQQKEEMDRIFTPDEFQEILEVMLNRFRKSPSKEILTVPNLVSLLFGWMQGSKNEREVSEWMKNKISSDEELLKVLPKLSSWTENSHRGVQYLLKKKELKRFLDYDSVVDRVRNISQNDKKYSPEDIKLAKELLHALKLGEDSF